MSSAVEAKYCNRLGDGGVVISKKRVNIVLKEHLGSLSWASQTSVTAETMDEFK